MGKIAMRTKAITGKITKEQEKDFEGDTLNPALPILHRIQLNMFPELIKTPGYSFDENEDAWKEQLSTYLVMLTAKTIKLIEFGDPSAPGDANYYTRLRIRLTKTPGGEQIGIRMVESFRGEGSGMYFQPDETGIQDAIRNIMAECHRYTKPHPNPNIQKYLEERHKTGHRPKLRFTAYMNEDHIQQPLLQRINARDEAEGRGFLPGAETIHLG